MKKSIIGIILILGILLPLLSSPAQARLEPPPVILSPADGEEINYLTHPPLAMPNFAWEPVFGATNYELLIAKDIAFTSPRKITTYNTGYTPDKGMVAWLEDNATYYWKIRATGVSNYSDYRTFKKYWATPDSGAPNAPVLDRPTEGETLEFFTEPTFSWLPVSGAAYYNFEISDDPLDFVGSRKYYANSIPNISHQPSAKLANGTYYWRVIPYDIGGSPGAVSEVRSFEMSYSSGSYAAPELLAPPNFDTPLFTPTFEWTAIPGAQLYRLEYSTDPNFASGVTAKLLNTTSHTPDQLPNDQDTYWRVRAESGFSDGKWSSTRQFRKQWYILPQLLTPVNGYPNIRYSPLMSWTPVPEAAYYKVEIGADEQFVTNRREALTLNPYYTFQGVNLSQKNQWYWRVTPYHSNGYAGKTTEAWSFRLDTWDTGVMDDPAPELFFPRFYYDPDIYSATYGIEATFDTHSVISAAMPIFGWSYSGIECPPAGLAPQECLDFAEQYHIEVSTSAIFTSLDWEHTTTQAHAVPTVDNPFTPVSGETYYWRVRSLDASGTPYASSPVSGWSQRWKVQFDTDLGLTPTTTMKAFPLRPTQGDQTLERAPLLEWWPVAGATRYKVEIARNEAMDRDLINDWAQYPAYAYAEHLDYGTYYWRAQAWDDTSALGEWSDVMRFQIARQTRWLGNYTAETTVTDFYTKNLLAEDPAGDALQDLVTLHIAPDVTDWNIGIEVISTTTQTGNYVFLIDTDQEDGSGAAADPVYGNAVVSGHQPEYALHLVQGPSGLTEFGGFNIATAYYYEYDSLANAWLDPDFLSNKSGSLQFITRTTEFTTTPQLDGLLLVKVSKGVFETPGNLSVQVFTTDQSGSIQDIIPSDDGGTLDTFVTSSSEVMMMSPPNNLYGKTTPSFEPMQWQPQLDTWLNSYYIEVAKDIAFSSIDLSMGPLSTHQYTVQDTVLLAEDDIYYWRIRVKHNQPTPPVSEISHPNSHPWRFERKGFPPPNLKVETLASKVTFSWGKVEGIDQYNIQWSSSPDYTGASSASVRNTSYTPLDLLSPGQYYWRVQSKDWKNKATAWVEGEPFTITLPAPSGLTVIPEGAVVPGTPTLTWDHYITPTTTPRFSAYKYRVQICEDENMSSGCRQIDTEQNSWTPPYTFNDGELYWRVYIIDGDNHSGEWTHDTPVSNFVTKQYPSTTLIAPLAGSQSYTVPAFIWEEVKGIAYYKIEIAKNPLFSPVFESRTTGATQITPLNNYPGGTYYWHVCVYDKANKPGPCSDATIILDPDDPDPLLNKLYLPMTPKSSQ